jgi:hypothetical protein
MRIHTLARLFTAFLAIPLLISSQVIGQTKKDGCNQPPQLIFKPHLSPEDVVRIKSSSLTGRVAVVVDENGSVAAAKVISANPKGGANILYEAVMTAKFKERPGCAPFKMDFIFNIRNR